MRQTEVKEIWNVDVNEFYYTFNLNIKTDKKNVIDSYSKYLNL